MDHEGTGKAVRSIPKTALGLGSCLVLTVLMFLFGEGFDAAFYPWAHSATGSPTLTGSWVGKLSSNPARIIFITLRRPRTSSGSYAHCPSCPDIEGSFRYCDADGISNGYRVSGRVRFWSGSSMKLWFNSLGPDFSTEEMPGTWDRADALTLTLGGKRSPSITDPPQPTHSVGFHHASESVFSEACARMAAR